MRWKPWCGWLRRQGEQGAGVGVGEPGGQSGLPALAGDVGVAAGDAAGVGAAWADPCAVRAACVVVVAGTGGTADADAVGAASGDGSDDDQSGRAQVGGQGALDT